jgi:hypothetical protein
MGVKLGLFTLRKEHRVKVFEKRVLRNIFGPGRMEVTGDWRKLYNVELQDLYSSPNINSSPNIMIIKLKRMRWVEHVAHMEENRNVDRVLVGKSEGKKFCKT